MRAVSTLKECLLLTPDGIDFQNKTLRPQAVPDWRKARDLIERAFRLPKRKLIITGTALPDEVRRSEAAQKELARQRAEMARRELISLGVDSDRLRVKIMDPSKMRVSDYAIGRVFFSFDPAWVEQEEFDPSWPGYENLCWVKQARSKSVPATPAQAPGFPDRRP